MNLYNLREGKGRDMLLKYESKRKVKAKFFSPGERKEKRANVCLIVDKFRFAVDIAVYPVCINSECILHT